MIIITAMVSGLIVPQQHIDKSYSVLIPEINVWSRKDSFSNYALYTNRFKTEKEVGAEVFSKTPGVNISINLGTSTTPR